MRFQYILSCFHIVAALQTVDYIRHDKFITQQDNRSVESDLNKRSIYPSPTTVSISSAPSQMTMLTNSPSGSSTLSPSSAPSYRTLIPSIPPSDIPTPQCHDLAGYKSPINDLPCSAFRNTPCLAWKHIGLTDTDIIELLQSCPQACNISCIISLEPSHSPSLSFEVIDAEVSFYISRVANTFDTGVLSALETMVEKYMIAHLTNDYIHSISFEIHSQSIISEGHTRNLRARRLGYSVLHISGKIICQTTDVLFTSETLETLFNQAIDSEIFLEQLMTELQLKDIVTSSALNDVGGSPDGAKKKSRGSVSVITSCLVAGCIAVLVIGFVCRRQRGKLYFEHTSPKHFPTNGEIQCYSNIEKDDDSTQRRQNMKFKLDFEDKLNHSEELRLSRWYDIDQTDSMFYNHSSKISSPTCDKQHGLEIKLSSLEASLSPSKIHTTIVSKQNIPSMIIFDNIDDDKLCSQSNDSHSSSHSSSSESMHDKFNQTTNVPIAMRVKRVEASSEFIKVLSANKNQNPIQAYNLLIAIKSTDDDDDEIGADKNKFEESPKTEYSSQISTGEIPSVLSTPCMSKMHDNFASSPHQKNLFTFERRRQDMDSEDDFAVLFDKSMTQSGKRTMLLGKLSLFKRKDRDNTEVHNSSHSFESHYESEDDVSDDLNSKYDQVITPELNFISSEAKGIISNDDFSDDEQRHTKSFMNTAHHRKSGSVFSFTSPHNEYTSNEISDLIGYSYNVFVPNSGKLGIMIHTKPYPTIYQVKDYSPLLGQVDVGDIITAIDDEDTTRMTTSDISRLFEYKRSYYSENAEKLKISILSTNPKSESNYNKRSSSLKKALDNIYDFPKGECELSDLPITSRSCDDDEQSCHLLGLIDDKDYDMCVAKGYAL